jgi:hypothetical protein
MGISDESSPFLLAHEPEGYRLVQAGPGGISQTWSSDNVGDDEPVRVLAPSEADPGGREVVRVSLTGFEGFQDGLDQAAAGYPAAGGEHFELDGHPAIYTPGHDEEGQPVRADLVVVAGDDPAIRVSATKRPGTSWSSSPARSSPKTTTCWRRSSPTRRTTWRWSGGRTPTSGSR